MIFMTDFYFFCRNPNREANSLGLSVCHERIRVEQSCQAINRLKNLSKHIK